MPTIHRVKDIPPTVGTAFEEWFEKNSPNIFTNHVLRMAFYAGYVTAMDVAIMQVKESYTPLSDEEIGEIMKKAGVQ